MNTLVESERIAVKIVKALNYTGLLCIEFFEMEDGTLLVNELAPRVHNSGHWTQSGCATSQFENHLRAISGAPAGDTSPLCMTAMLNLVGVEKPGLDDLSPQAQLHWYNKAVRPGRKLGHINFTGASLGELVRQLPAERARFHDQVP